MLEGRESGVGGRSLDGRARLVVMCSWRGFDLQMLLCLLGYSRCRSVVLKSYRIEIRPRLPGLIILAARRYQSICG